MQASAVILYTPGPIVHIFKEITGYCFQSLFVCIYVQYVILLRVCVCLCLIGAYDAVVLSHKHKTFERIQLLLEHAVEDHKMMNYRSVITAIQFVQRQRQTLSPRSDPSSLPSSYGASSSWISSNKKKIPTTEKKVTNEIRTRQVDLTEEIFFFQKYLWKFMILQYFFSILVYCRGRCYC